jgi:hypothetical protein
MVTKVKYYPGALENLLNSPTGEVGRYLKSKGNEILTVARAMVGVRTGKLRSSLHMRHMRDARGQYVWVGSKLDYALAHHEGTAPRTITPKSGKVLRFVSRGQVVYAHSVQHPGTRANRYLTKALQAKI